MNKLLPSFAIAMCMPMLAIAQQVPGITAAVQSSSDGGAPVVLTPSFGAPTQASTATPERPAPAPAVAAPPPPAPPAVEQVPAQQPAPTQAAAAESTSAPPAPQFSRAKKKPSPKVQKMQETFDLEQRAKVAEYLGSNMQKPTAARNRGSATVYSFSQGSIYVVYAGLNRVTDVMLQPGEKLPNGAQSFVAGDTDRWIVTPITSGDGESTQTHLIIKPLDDGITTNLVIATDRRVYILDLRSVDDWYMPGVSWSYPEEAMKAFAMQAQQTQKVSTTTASIAVSAEDLDFDYKVKHPQAWAPEQVFNDGTHTYLRMPKSVKSGEAPVLFVIENKQPIYVNYRVKATSGDGGPLYEVDRIFDRAELRVGTGKPVQIIRHPRWYQ